jgi:hypothetical protein
VPTVAHHVTSQRRAHVAVAVLLVLVVAISACSEASTQPEPNTTTRPPKAERPKRLLLFEQSPLPVEALAARRAAVDRLPFDGLMFTIDASSTVQSGLPVGLDELRRQLAPLRTTSFERVRHNFLLVYATPAGSFDDYAPVVANFADLAEAAHESGAEGIFFDNEEYFGPTWHPDVACPGLDLVACRALARETGRAVMAAMVQRWPDVKLLTASGPWLSDPDTYDHLKTMGYNDIADANRVWGAFAVGLLEGAAGTGAAYVDGGGIYTQRSYEDLLVAYDWFHYGLPETGEIVPDDMRSSYASEVEVAFGVYDFPERYRGKVSDPGVWHDDIVDALRASDEYVWAYSERYNWTANPLNPETPAVPREYLQATAEARATASTDGADGAESADGADRATTTTTDGSEGR